MARRSEEDATLRKIRELVRMRIEATSLRRTANEIRLSPTGLTGFVNGKAAHQMTRAKVLQWYALQAWKEGLGVSGEVAQASLSLLLQHVPEPARDPVRAEMLRLLARATDAQGVPRPDWLAEAEGGEEGGPAKEQA